MAANDCPLCDGEMHIRQGDVTETVPGTPQRTTMKTREWVCPECEYFEGDEDGAA